MRADEMSIAIRHRRNKIVRFIDANRIGFLWFFMFGMKNMKL